jgi:hypothetical protein
VPIAINEALAAEKSRIAAIRLSVLTLRLMDNWRVHVKDYDGLMILIAVVAITSEKLIRSPLEAELRNLDIAIPKGRLGRCNISSIAAGTSLNRETARRKVNELIAAGLLTRDSEGSIRFPDGMLQEPRTLEMVRRQIESIARTADELLRDGILEIDPARSR